jgi:signal transduction histidine kinase
MKSSISVRIALAVAAMHAIVLPALYFGLSVVVSRNHIEVFIEHVRTLSRNLAVELELGNAMDTQQRVRDMLDLAVLNGDGVYAELIDNGRQIRSNMSTRTILWPGRQDFGFGQGGDHTYFIELPIVRPGHSAELRIGFDERPTNEQIQLAMRQTLWVLASYFCVAMVAAVAWGYRLSRPVVQLQLISRRIASGDYAQSLRLRTGVLELHELGTDLEEMRKELVGVNEKLRTEIVDRERAEGRHRDLENRLRHRQRLETVGTLASGIAHEINNVLLPIVLFTESALADSPEHTSVHNDLQEVLASAYRATEVVDKILTFSRNAGAPKLEWIDLEPVVREAVRLFSALIPASVELRTELSGPYPAVKADAALTIQLIMNLCTNAYHALAGAVGNVTVGLNISTEPLGMGGRTPPTGYVVLSVADTGVGMDSATAERIFEPFYTTREVGAGTGLGLSVVHGIVESFGATISVDTAVGRGTIFKISFPASEKMAASEPPAAGFIGVQS